MKNNACRRVMKKNEILNDITKGGGDYFYRHRHMIMFGGRNRRMRMRFKARWLSLTIPRKAVEGRRDKKKAGNAWKLTLRTKLLDSTAGKLFTRKT